jgi:hypothetical protein
MTRRTGFILLVAAAVALVSLSPALADHNEQKKACGADLNGFWLDVGVQQVDVFGSTSILGRGVAKCDGHRHSSHAHHAHPKHDAHRAHPRPHAHHAHHPQPSHHVPASVSHPTSNPNGRPTSHDVPTQPRPTAETKNPAPRPPKAVVPSDRPIVRVLSVGRDALVNTASIGLRRDMRGMWWVLAGLIVVPFLLYSFRRALSE